MKHYSPLRYPGGKGKIANYVGQIIERNSLLDGTYVEPYAGGASVGLSLLYGEYVSDIIINDFDKSIYSFWHSILNSVEDFSRMIYDTKINVKNWNKNKEIQNNKDSVSMLELGFSTFFLNRTNRSGILNAGIIGGKEQTGEWKIDARFNKENLIDRIQKVARFKDRIKLYNADACNLIKRLDERLGKNAIFYFDPPYYVKGRDLYLSFYNHKDHAKVAKTISNIKSCKWVVTYDNQAEIKELYSDYQQLEYSLSYSAGATGTGKEVMIFSDGLQIPEGEVFTAKR